MVPRWTAFGRIFGVLVAMLALLGQGGAASAQTLPAGFQLDTVFSGRTQPVAVRFAPDGRVFVAEKSGLLYAYDSVLDPTPTLVIDLRVQVHNFWDRGMLGLAVAPGFPADPTLYVSYTHDAFADGTRAALGLAPIRS